MGNEPLLFLPWDQDHFTVSEVQPAELSSSQQQQCRTGCALHCPLSQGDMGSPPSAEP